MNQTLSQMADEYFEEVNRAVAAYWTEYDNDPLSPMLIDYQNDYAKYDALHEACCKSLRRSDYGK